MSDEAAVLRMAHRDAAAQLLPARYGNTVRIRPVVLACPWCGADQRPDWAFPLRAWQRGPDWAPASTEVRLTLLGCERLTARALLPLVDAARTEHVQEFSTRAVTWLRLGRPDLDTLDQQEARAGAVTRTLPVATATIAAPGHDFTAWRRSIQPHFLAPHQEGGRFDDLNTIYLAARFAAIAGEIPAPHQGE